MTRKEFADLIVVINDTYHGCVTNANSEAWYAAMKDTSAKEARGRLTDHMRTSQYPPKPFDLINHPDVRGFKGEMISTPRTSKDWLDLERKLLEKTRVESEAMFAEDERTGEHPELRWETIVERRKNNGRA